MWGLYQPHPKTFKLITKCMTLCVVGGLMILSLTAQHQSEVLEEHYQLEQLERQSSSGSEEHSVERQSSAGSTGHQLERQSSGGSTGELTPDELRQKRLRRFEQLRH